MEFDDRRGQKRVGFHLSEATALCVIGPEFEEKAYAMNASVNTGEPTRIAAAASVELNERMCDRCRFACTRHLDPKLVQQVDRQLAHQLGSVHVGHFSCLYSVCVDALDFNQENKRKQLRSLLGCISGAGEQAITYVPAATVKATDKAR